MSDDQSEVLTSLPRTRPHRRSAKRAATPSSGSAARNTSAPPKPRPVNETRTQRLRQPAQPGGTPVTRRQTKPPAPSRTPGGTDILGTAVQAAAELAEIGLSVGARALRRAVSRLPHP